MGQGQQARLRRMEELGSAYSQHTYHELITLVREEQAAGRSLPGPFVALLRRTMLETYAYSPELAALTDRITDPVLSPGEAWADQALADAARFGEPGRRLLLHLKKATSAKPTAAWDRTAAALIDEIGGEETRRAVLDWLRLAGQPRTHPLHVPQGWPDHNGLIDPYNADALRGAAWLAALLPPSADVARALGALVETALRKVRGIGPRAPKIAGAGVTALSRTGGEAALAVLARLSARVTYKGTLKQLGAALDARAVALGLSREDVEELAVPSYGLTEPGRGERLLGDCTAVLEVRGTKAVLSWRTAAGRTVTSVPAAVRRDFPDEVKELRAEAKDIDKTLTACSERLDRLFLARRDWDFRTWRERYVDHPLVGTLARRLIWLVGGTVPIAFDGTDVRTLEGDPVCASKTARVELWHPAGRPAAEIVAWRDWLEARQITQPFKQAHREVYPLTDAERTTGTYSNRFAGHVLNQHQFNALAAVRGWTAKLRLSVDDSYPPAVRELPAWGLRAEYWIEGIGGAEDGDLTGSGAYTRVSTDQVRFHAIDAPPNWAHAGGGEYHQGRDRFGGGAPAGPVPLTEVPELVLSEVLRDVDLFVGVSSIGNDPTWQDGGPRGRHRAYWTSYGFGELSETAATRRDLLTRLVPRLAIADRCTVDGRFLRVRGDRHTYRVHLGSGNVLIDPHERYLCIVPERGGTAVDTGCLPFEGDRMLGVVLSKAMLLARDTEITDPTILSQL
ncbi:DUF4132 domain-containing protein [Streptomyces sp. NPDC015127]|uniref:DUF4132 domain-containing protein n=1 Tax=Streptomyces sp. NPDC015127 TaxID=3364939 RepID=UPI0036F7489C